MLNITNCCLVARSCPALLEPLDCKAFQPPLSIEFPRQNPGVGRHLLLQAVFLTQSTSASSASAERFFTTEPPWKYHWVLRKCKSKAQWNITSHLLGWVLWKKRKKEREGERERGEGRRQKHLVHVYQQQSLGKTNIIKLFPLLRISSFLFWWGQPSLLSLLTQMLVFQGHLHRYTLIRFYQLSRHPLTQSRWCIKLTITPNKSL